MEMGLTEARSTCAPARETPVRSTRPGFVPEAPADASIAESCCGEPLRPFWADDGRYISVCMRCGKENSHRHMVRYNGSPWIGVDLDGTLAEEIPGNQDPETIGEPVPAMMARVREWLADGQCVKIFTARASVPSQVTLVKEWLKAHDLPDLEVTNAKDFRMIELWDDRAVRVNRNSGQPLHGHSREQANRDAKVKIVARRKRGSFASKLRMFFAL